MQLKINNLKDGLELIDKLIEKSTQFVKFKFWVFKAIERRLEHFNLENKNSKTLKRG